MTNNFIYTYKPTSMVDSIAQMCVMYDNVSIGDKHRDLAKIYIDKGEKRKAFNEYHALIKYSPYNSYLYYEALKLLMDLNDYQTALKIMLDLPNRDTIYFANLQIGKLYQHLNEHEKAIQSFAKAKTLIAKNDNLEALLIAEYNSCEALNDSKRAALVLQQIVQVNPGFKQSDTHKKEVVVYLDKQIRDVIQEAIKQIKQQKYSEALVLLDKSLKIKE